MVKNPYALHNKFAKIKEKIESEYKQPSPSTIASERARKHELARAQKHLDNTSTTYKNDCRGCTDECHYPNLEICHKPTRTGKCAKCGILVRYRLLLDEEWSMCPVCRELP